MSAATHATQLMTAEQLFMMPRGKHCYELIDGVLHTMTPAGSEHGAVTMSLGGLLAEYVKRRALGVVFAAETGYLLKRKPDTVRAPDVSFITKKRVPKTGLPESYWPGPPDLAAEVLSPSDTVKAVGEKIKQWLKSGVRLVWVVDPRMKTVTIHRTATDIRILTISDTLDGEDVVPGFSCRVANLF